MKRLAIAFTGPSNSGKTTIIEKISKQLSKNYKIAIIKHDPKDKAEFDKEGKDSYKFFNSGADVAVVSPTRTTVFKHQSSSLSELVEYFKDFDLLLVEGLKTWELPRIGVFRGKIEESYLPFVDAVAIDNTIDKETIKDKIVLDLNNTQEIIDYIFKNAKKIGEQNG